MLQQQQQQQQLPRISKEQLVEMVVKLSIDLVRAQEMARQIEAICQDPIPAGLPAPDAADSSASAGPSSR